MEHGMQHRLDMQPSSSQVHTLPLVRTIHVRDLAADIEVLRDEAMRRDDGFCMKTLSRDAELRSVLFAMKGGSRLRIDQLERDSISIRVLEGFLELHVGDAWDMLPYPVRHTEGACSFFALYEHTIGLPGGSLLALDPRLARDIEALEDSAFILHVPTYAT